MFANLNRVVPQLGPAAYQTFQISAPRSTHTRPGTCAEIGCQAYEHGWRTRVPSGGALEATVRSSGRRWVSVFVDGPETVFTFAPGTVCFRASEHRVSLERPEIYLVKGGDWRGNPTQMSTRVHTSADSWVDEFATHQEQLTKDRG